jgi:DNA-binding NarL/FixJ family response regulator
MSSSDIIQVILVGGELLQSRQIKHYLETNDFFILRHARSIAEALPLVQNQPPDVVLLDTSISDDQTPFIAFMEHVLNIPVIALVSIDQTDLIVKTIQSGVYNWLLKSNLSARGLKTEIQSALQRKARQIRTAKLSDEQKRINHDLAQMTRAAWAKIQSQLGNLVETVDGLKIEQKEKDRLTREITLIMELSTVLLRQMAEELSPVETPAERQKAVASLVRAFSGENNVA